MVVVKRIALIKSGVVENVILAGESYEPPAGCFAVDVTETSVGPGWTYADEVFAAPAPSTPLPDTGALMEAVFTTFGKPAARAMARAYPDLTLALDRERWDLVREGVEDMLADGFLTQPQYDALQGLLASHGIPEVEQGG